MPYSPNFRQNPAKTTHFTRRSLNFTFKEFKADTGELKLSEVISVSTFPEISGAEVQERISWFDGYLTTILQRGVRILAEISKISTLPNLLRIIANRVGGLVNEAVILPGIRV